jgi:hypothetical protein
MRRRVPVASDEASFYQNNGTLTNRRGRALVVNGQQNPGPPPTTNSLLVQAHLVSVGPAALDGTTTVVDGWDPDGLDVLLQAQADPTENGLWRAYNGADWVPINSAAHVDGVMVNILGGDVYHDTTWRLVTDNPIARGTTALTFYQWPPLDHAKATTIAGQALLVGAVGFTPVFGAEWVFPAGTFPNGELNPIHVGPADLAAGTFTFGPFRYSGNYNVGCSILCGFPTGAAIVAVALLKNGVYEQELIRRWVTATDERHYGASNVTVDAVAGDVLSVQFFDPAAAGYLLTLSEMYVDLVAGNRR